MSPKMKQKLVSHSRESWSPRRGPLAGRGHTHTTQCRKTFTGNAIEDILISIYIFFYLDYLQEKKAALFENIKISTFLFFVKH